MAIEQLFSKKPIKQPENEDIFFVYIRYSQTPHTTALRLKVRRKVEINACPGPSVYILARKLIR
jgi:hypothetical protein